MADNDSTNTSPLLQLTAEALTALTGRLVSHADGIENIAVQGMADDMRLAAHAIEMIGVDRETHVDRRRVTEHPPAVLDVVVGPKVARHVECA